MKKLQQYLPWVLLSFGVFAILSCTLVSFVAPPMYDDYILFQYGGWRITEGARLFADVWDHKSPFIFWMSALGFYLVPNSIFGVDVLIMMMWLVVLYCSYNGCKYFFSNTVSAFIATLIVLGGVAYGCGVRFSGSALQTVEGLTLMFWSIGFYLWAKTKDREFCWWVPVSLGMIVASGVMCKASFVGFGLFLVAIWGWNAIEKRSFMYLAKYGFYSFIGFSLVVGFIIFLFALSGTVEDFYDAAWHFNVYEYKSDITLNTLVALAFAWRAPIKLPFYFLWVLLTGLGMLFLLWKLSFKKWKVPCAIGFWFVTETILVLLAGRCVFEHYLIIGYLPLFILLAFIISKDECFHWIRKLGLLAGIILMLAFSVRLIIGLEYKMSWADRQRVALNVPEIAGRPVAVRGFISTAKVMLVNKAFTPQKYFCHYGVRNSDRQQRMESDLYKALINPNTAAFIVEGRLDEFLDKYRLDEKLLAAIQKYRYNRTLDLAGNSVEIWLPIESRIK